MSLFQERRATGSPEDSRIQRSLSYCWKEGIPAQVMIGIMDYYLIPFALLLGASNAEVGLLIALPNLLSSFSQFLAVPTLRWAGSRLRHILWGVFIQSLFLLPVGLLSFLDVPHKITILIGAVLIFKIIANVIGPVWGSLVSEYLPAHRRGSYFGWRSRILGITGLVNIIFWGAFLYYWKRMADERWAFLILFAAAGTARLMSMYFMAKMEDLPYHTSRESDFTFWMFLRRFRESNFVKFVFFVSSVMFAAYLSAPFVSVHMLSNLKFNYLNYMGVHLAAVLASLISFPIWGRHADQIGNARILKITSFFIPLIPLMWVLPRNPYVLMGVELFSGFIWGGFNLCATNFIFDAVTPSKRVRCLGYFNLINGCAIFAGASLGGYLSTHLPPTMGMSIISLFLISSAVRFSAYFFLSPTFKEVRAEARTVSSSELFFSVVGIRPLNTEINGLVPQKPTDFTKR